MAARVQYRRDGSADVRFTFDRSLVQELKLMVPFSHRDYDPLTKSWQIHWVYVTDVVGLLRRYYPGAVEVLDAPKQQRREPTPINPWERALTVLHLRDTAQDGLIEVACKYLARQAHPDTGGNDEAMRRLNGAVEALRQRRVAS